jgi:hypothetical protein
MRCAAMEAVSRSLSWTRFLPENRSAKLIESAMSLASAGVSLSSASDIARTVARPLERIKNTRIAGCLGHFAQSDTKTAVTDKSADPAAHPAAFAFSDPEFLTAVRVARDQETSAGPFQNWCSAVCAALCSVSVM